MGRFFFYNNSCWIRTNPDQSRIPASPYPTRRTQQPDTSFSCWALLICHFDSQHPQIHFSGKRPVQNQPLSRRQEMLENKSRKVIELCGEASGGWGSAFALLRLNRTEGVQMKICHRLWMFAMSLNWHRVARAACNCMFVIQRVLYTPLQLLSNGIVWFSLKWLLWWDHIGHNRTTQYNVLNWRAAPEIQIMKHLHTITQDHLSLPLQTHHGVMT